MGRGAAPLFEISGEAGSGGGLLHPESRRARRLQPRGAEGPGGAEDALLALPVRLDRPPHPRLRELFGLDLPGVILPLGRETAHGRDWLICRAPRGPALAAEANVPFDPRGLEARLLRPAAAALAALAEHGLTHRAIRADNLFCGPNGVELGPFWLGPPAADQPATHEPPHVASAIPAARGPGRIADDVYALGVVLLERLLGRLPLAGLDPAAIVARKLWEGSLPALLSGRRLPAGPAELLGAMLADDADRRPPPARLACGAPISAPPASVMRRPHAVIPLRLGGHEIWTTRQLAWVFAEAEAEAWDLLRRGVIDEWLRRSLRDPSLADRIEALHRDRRPDAARAASAPPDRSLIGRAAVLLDPDAPLTWGCLRLDAEAAAGIVPGTAPSDPDRDTLSALLSSDLPAFHARRSGGDERARERRAARAGAARHAMRSELDRLRLLHARQPSLGCLSQHLRDRPVTDATDLPGALEAILGALPAGAPLLDAAMTAFILAHGAAPNEAPPAGEHAELRLLLPLAREAGCGPLPGLAARLARPLIAGLERWPGRSCREARRARIDAAVGSGDLPALHRLATDREALRRDLARAASAEARLASLRAERAREDAAGPARAAAARRFGRDGSAALGVAAAAASLLAAIL